MSRYARAIALAAAAALIPAFLLVVGAGTAAADPSADDWYQLRTCEASNNYQINTGNGYYGAYQFNLGTWESAGGAGYPHEANAIEQDYRALILYRQRGWQPWPACTKKLGLVDDADAGSGVIPPAPDEINDSPAGHSPSESSTSPPPWPGQTFYQGNYYDELKIWQRRAGSLGYGLTGTGLFGPKTEEAVLAIQEKAGLNVVGYIGPKTWAAAWDSGNARSSADRNSAERNQVPTGDPFPDVTPSTAHHSNIAWLKHQGITRPIDGLYKPDQPVNRGSMAAFLFRLTHPGEIQPSCTSKPFPDVTTDHLFCGYIQWAKDSHIAFGYGDGTYQPGNDVTRGAMSAFLYRIANPTKTAAQCTSKPFTDIKVNSEFCGSITWAKANDITYGAGGHHYNVSGDVTRGSMASFLHRIYDHLD